MMAYLKRSLLCGMICILSLSTTVSAYTVSSYPAAAQAAEYLHEKKIMVGDANGNIMLNEGLTRAQMAVLLARISVAPEHLETEREHYSKQCDFTDVPDWARPYVGFCSSNSLVSGYGNGLYGSNDPVTPAAACTVLLRCLEGISSDWTYKTACQKAVEVGIAPVEAVQGEAISRGDMAILLYNTILMMSGETAPNIDQNGQETVPDIGQSSTEIEDLRQEMIRLINEVRRENGVPELMVDDRLMAAAQECSSWKMKDHRNREECETVIAHGYPYGFGGNLTAFTNNYGTDTAKHAVDNWVNSPGHFQTMINSRCDTLGVGITMDDTWVYCHMFVGDPSSHNPYE